MNIWKKFIGLFKTVEVETTYQSEKLDDPISEVDVKLDEVSTVEDVVEEKKEEKVDTIEVVEKPKAKKPASKKPKN